MSLTTRELAIMRTPPGPNYRGRLDTLIARLRGFGIVGRGTVSDGRGITMGTGIPNSVVLLPESDDLAHFSGDTGSFDINDNSPVLPVANNNDLSLKLSGSNTREIGSNSGLDNYPSVDVTFEVSHYVDVANSTAVELYYNVDRATGIISNGSGYGLNIRPDNSDIGVFRRDSGSFSSIDIQNYNWNTGWYSWSVTHQSDGTIVWSVTEVDTDTEVASGNMSDSKYITSGSFDYNYVAFRVVSDTPSFDLWHQPNS